MANRIGDFRKMIQHPDFIVPYVALNPGRE
jgi:hypothetical protein